MYHDILIPTDGSEGTNAALEHAMTLANTFGSTLHALFVVDTAIDPEMGIIDLLDAMEEAGQAAVDDLIERATASGVEDVDGSVVSGSAYQSILDYAEANDIDLIVMGTHGRAGLDRYLLGSVTEKVVRLSDAPVLTVRLRDDADH